MLCTPKQPMQKLDLGKVWKRKKCDLELAKAYSSAHKISALLKQGFVFLPPANNANQNLAKTFNPET